MITLYNNDSLTVTTSGVTSLKLLGANYTITEANTVLDRSLTQKTFIRDINEALIINGSNVAVTTVDNIVLLNELGSVNVSIKVVRNGISQVIVNELLLAGEKLTISSSLGAFVTSSAGVVRYLSEKSDILPSKRKTAVIYGNSIAAQNMRDMLDGSTNTTADTLAGSNVLTVASNTAFTMVATNVYAGGTYTIVSIGTTDFTLIGASANTVGITFVATATGVGTGTVFPSAQLVLHNQQIFISPVIGVLSTNKIMLRDKLPAVALSGGKVHALQGPYTKIRTNDGPLFAALASLDMPLDLLPGYGHIGMLLSDMVHELPEFLDFYNPDYVLAHIFENDIGINTITKILADAEAFVNICLNKGAIPVIFSSVPRTSFNTPAENADYDTIANWVANLSNTITGAIGINISEAWLDKADPTTRSPLAGYTVDGTHPAATAYMTIGKLLLSSGLDKVVSQGKRLTKYASLSFPATGTGGSTSGSVTGVVADLFRVTADAGSVAVCSKTETDAQRIVGSVAGTTTYNSNRFIFGLPTAYAVNQYFGNRWFKFGFRFRLNAAANIYSIEPTLIVNGGFQTPHSVGEALQIGADPAMIGTTVSYESSPVLINGYASGFLLSLYVKPATNAVANQTVLDIEIFESYIIPASKGEMYI